MLVSNYLMEEEEEAVYSDPTSNVCTEAALCLFFRYGDTGVRVVTTEKRNVCSPLL